MYSKGDRVKLLHVNDPYTRLAPGTLDRQDVAPDDPTNSYVVEEDPDEDGRWNVLPNSGENDPPETYIVRSGDVYFVYLFIRGFGGLQIPVSFRDFTRAVDTALLLAVEKGKEQS